MDPVTWVALMLAIAGAIGCIVLAAIIIWKNSAQTTGSSAYTYFYYIGIIYLIISVLLSLIFQEDRADFAFFALLGVFFTVVGYLNKNIV